ncbi:MAG: helicase-related protein [Acutalibacter sp.]
MCTAAPARPWRRLRGPAAAWLRRHPLPRGLEDQERLRNQEDFLYDRATVMVATNAFGMGIDKSNVSFVIHYTMPKDLRATTKRWGWPAGTAAPPSAFCCGQRADVAPTGSCSPTATRGSTSRRRPWSSSTNKTRPGSRP